MNDLSSTNDLSRTVGAAPRRFLLHAIGSHGDVLPLVRLAAALQERGCEVHLFIHAMFAGLARDAGLTVTPLGRPEDEDVLRDADLVHERRAHAVFARVIADMTPEAYRAMAAELRAAPAVVIGNSVAFACHLLRETHAAPCVVVHYAPAVLRSKRAPARLARHAIAAPAAVYPALWWALDRWFVDPLYARPLNRFRATLGLAPISRVVHSWIHRAELVLGLFPDWFAEPQPDWPRAMQLSGFPLQSRKVRAALPAAITAFLDAGPAPTGFTAGTHTATAREFFEASAEACRLTGRRGIFLTRFADQVPRGLPPDIVHFGYAPFDALLPRLAAIVHHGGIGTTSQALAAGVPQLIRPTSFDQFDNSRRACALGVAREVLAPDYSPAVVANALGELLTPRTLRHCAERSQQLAQADGIGQACEIILGAALQPAVAVRAVASQHE